MSPSQSLSPMQTGYKEVFLSGGWVEDWVGEGGRDENEEEDEGRSVSRRR